jgi:hypothetical protein
MVLAWAAMTVIAAVSLIGCWYWASGEYAFDDQKTALDLAVITVVLANLVGALLVLAGRRAVRVRRARLLCDMPGALARRAVAPHSSDVDPRDRAGLVGGAGLTRYHRAGCQLASGRDWPEASQQTHEQEGRRPCGVCRP